MFNDEEVVKYEQLLRDYKDIFAWGCQDMSGLDLNVFVCKLPVSEGIKPTKQPQHSFCPEMTI